MWFVSEVSPIWRSATVTVASVALATSARAVGAVICVLRWLQMRHRPLADSRHVLRGGSLTLLLTTVEGQDDVTGGKARDDHIPIDAIGIIAQLTHLRTMTRVEIRPHGPTHF